MEEQKTTTYQEAFAQGQVKENDYFLVRYPGGQDKLFRLVKTEKGYVMWGPPTDGKVLFNGQEGYDNLFALADTQVEKEFSLPEVFEEVHACGLPQREYEVHSSQEMCKILNDVRTMYEYLDDAEMVYILSAHCVYIDSNRNSANFRVFIVGSGSVNYYSLRYSYGYTYYASLAVRPEAIPKPTIRLFMDGCDGSKANPWICN